MKRMFFAALGVAALLGLGAVLGAAAPAFWGGAARADAVDKTPRRIAIHVDESDPKRMNLALNNAQNLSAYYQEQGAPLEIRVVANGPGLEMLRADRSPVAARIAAMSLEMDNITFAACANTRRAITEAEGAEPPLLEEAEIVPSGVVELVELQRQGWSYLRP